MFFGPSGSKPNKFIWFLDRRYDAAQVRRLSSGEPGGGADAGAGAGASAGAGAGAGAGGTGAPDLNEQVFNCVILGRTA